ncbi:hypothetical protein BCR33DRAFT_715488 [Rhizoclosmatium globosum]|uniref:Uncharacterized protein n=1 Tax=Rhizoclosmatium globosum TaxID=329046 RepID=A0A1Y2CH79_9FUNG|nr:hypothetical protein BCR33DRAFT_715488 [Rhizoclosmatium globosum]|eukprot:ORY46389.1 hypothetical protein BCR33DRAFT_715488 [Rhizoclosmatium globosum]
MGLTLTGAAVTSSVAIEDLESDLYDFLDNYGDEEEEEVPAGDAQFTVDTSKFLSIQEPQVPSSVSTQPSNEPVAAGAAKKLEDLDFKFEGEDDVVTANEQQREVEQVAQADNTDNDADHFPPVKNLINHFTAIAVAQDKRVEEAPVPSSVAASINEEVFVDAVPVIEEVVSAPVVVAPVVAPVEEVPVAVEEVVEEGEELSVVSGNGLERAESKYVIHQEVPQPVAVVGTVKYEEQASVVVDAKSAVVERQEVIEEPVAPPMQPQISERSASTKERSMSIYSESFSIFETDSVLDSDIQVQIIRLRGQIDRTRILINEQLRLRNMPPLEPGQYSLPAIQPSKRGSIISTVSNAVYSAITSPTAQDLEIQRMREELERTKREIADKQKQTITPYTPAPPPANVARPPPQDDQSDFPGVDKVIEYKKPTKNNDSASITSGKSNKSNTGSGWAADTNDKPVKERKKSIKPNADKPPPLYMSGPHMMMGGGGRF